MEWTESYSTEQLGVFIRKARKTKGYTQDEFAEVIGVSHATLSALENGRSVSFDTVMKALANLGFKLAVVPKNAQLTLETPQ